MKSVSHEVPDLQMEQEDNLPGQMTFGMEKSEFSGKNDKYSQEPENEMEANENEGLEPDSEEGDPEFRAVEETDEVPFEEAEEEFTEEFEAQEKEESEPDEVAKARNMVCDFGLFKGYTLGEMMTNVKGRATVKWLIDKYNGGNIKIKKAARFLLEQEERRQHKKRRMAVSKNGSRLLKAICIETFITIEDVKHGFIHP
ncbi:MAG: hypothetical protein ACLUTU_09775 [Blautia faecis]